MNNYKEIPALLRAHAPFNGNSMSAYVASDGSYVVMSYSTVIATAYPDGTVIFNDRKYSQTTSRQQNLCHANL